jgi:CheY-like chemotaxis protein
VTGRFGILPNFLRSAHAAPELVEQLWSFARAAYLDNPYDGRSALVCARATVPEIVLCDLGLPGGMDGYAVARALRAEPRLLDARIIALSGYSRPQDHANAKQAGFDRLVPKPITADFLEALLNEPPLK